MRSNWQSIERFLIALCLWHATGCGEPSIPFTIVDGDMETSDFLDSDVNKDTAAHSGSDVDTDMGTDADADPNGDGDKDADTDSETSSNTETACVKDATYVFAQDLNGYAGTEDGELFQAYPDTSYPVDPTVSSDYNSGTEQQQPLIRFQEIFGTGVNQVRVGAPIRKATLEVYTIDDSDNDISIYPMLVPWREDATWNSMSCGIQTDDIEAALSAEDTLSKPKTGMFNSFDVTASVSAWSVVPASNHGWAFLNEGSDGFDFKTSEHKDVAHRPRLTIEVDDCE